MQDDQRDDAFSALVTDESILVDICVRCWQRKVFAMWREMSRVSLGE